MTNYQYFEIYKPDYVVHLAAQAGVRYSIENPRSYLDSNINGTFNILELIKIYSTKHLLLASTSSVYGATTEMPFSENQKTEHQISSMQQLKSHAKYYLILTLTFIIYQ